MTDFIAVPNKRLVTSWLQRSKYDTAGVNVFNYASPFFMIRAPDSGSTWVDPYVSQGNLALQVLVIGSVHPLLSASCMPLFDTPLGTAELLLLVVQLGLEWAMSGMND